MLKSPTGLHRFNPERPVTAVIGDLLEILRGLGSRVPPLVLEHLVLASWALVVDFAETGECGEGGHSLEY